jgi:hypothetical protein
MESIHFLLTCGWIDAEFNSGSPFVVRINDASAVLLSLAVAVAFKLLVIVRRS